MDTGTLNRLIGWLQSAAEKHNTPEANSVLAAIKDLRGVASKELAKKSAAASPADNIYHSLDEFYAALNKEFGIDIFLPGGEIRSLFEVTTEKLNELIPWLDDAMIRHTAQDVQEVFAAMRKLREDTAQILRNRTMEAAGIPVGLPSAGRVTHSAAEDKVDTYIFSAA
jgi:hypothetical protein